MHRAVLRPFICVVALCVLTYASLLPRDLVRQIKKYGEESKRMDENFSMEEFLTGPNAHPKLSKLAKMSPNHYKQAVSMLLEEDEWKSFAKKSVVQVR